MLSARKLISSRCHRYRRLSSSVTSNATRTNVEYFVVGTLSGCAGALVGLGGAFIALPFLSGYFNLTQNIAHGTSMTVVLATSLGSTVSYGNQPLDSTCKRVETMFGSIPETIGSVHVVNALCLAATSSITVIAGAWISKRSPAKYLKLAHGCLMMVVGPMIPGQDYFKQRNVVAISPSKTLVSSPIDVSHLARPMTIGIFSGLLAGFFGVGGGAIMVPALCFFSEMDYHTALGTSLAAMLPTATIGTITQFRQGMIFRPAVIPLSVGCLVGSYLGGQIGKSVPEKQLKYGFAVLMLGMGSRTILQAVKLIRLAK